jgi:hypothetical protein
LNHIRFAITITTTSDNKIAITRTKNNLLTNNYIVVNKGIKKTTTNSLYNRELDSASIWNTCKIDYSMDRVILLYKQIRFLNHKIINFLKISFLNTILIQNSKT